MADNPHEGHRERLRARFRENSLDSFAPHEALELLLSYCIPKRDVNPLAHQLIERFGSFAQVLDAAPEELESVAGIGAYSATFLNLVAQAAGYYQRSKFAAKPRILSAAEMGRYCASLFINDTGEKLYLISLNIHGELISRALISSGSIDELVIYTRDVVNAALRANAYAVVLTHNHPGGSIRPSDADIRTTLDIRNALNAINLTLLDHIIVGGGRFASMAAQGFMDDEAPSPMLNMYLEYLMRDDEPSDAPPKLPSAARPDAMAAESGEVKRRRGAGRGAK